jgi:ubiquinone/menaquinone biosynthesis C-methylase UbiE
MSRKLSIEEIENLSYYDFMGYLGVPFFNIGGHGSMDRLAEMCHIGAGTRVLEVGCGTGGNACYLAEKYGCTVVGIDIAEQMVRQATRKAEERGLADRVSFRVGDAYHLGFPDATFDAVVTVFVSLFLDPTKAFPEFLRVLKDGGYLGINEMYRAEDVPPGAMAKVDETERIYRELTKLPFTLRSPAMWSRSFESAGFADVTLEEHPNANEIPYSEGVIEEFGGWGKFIGTIWNVIVYALRSGKIRKKYVSLGSAKKTLLSDKETSKYIGYVLAVGMKNQNKN